MTNKQKYDFAHKWAKVVVSTVVISLMIVVHFTGLFILNALGVVIWFFGVNPIACLIEHMKGFKPNHHWF